MPRKIRQPGLRQTVTADKLTEGCWIDVPGSKLLAGAPEDCATIQVGKIEPLGVNHLRVEALPSKLVIYFKVDELVDLIEVAVQESLF